MFNHDETEELKMKSWFLPPPPKKKLCLYFQQTIVFCSQCNLHLSIFFPKKHQLYKESIPHQDTWRTAELGLHVSNLAL